LWPLALSISRKGTSMSYLDSVTLAIEAVLAWDYVPEDLFSDAVAAQACLLAGKDADSYVDQMNDAVH